MNTPNLNIAFFCYPFGCGDYILSSFGTLKETLINSPRLFVFFFFLGFFADHFRDKGEYLGSVT